jgi:sulfate transport system permease protein
MQTVVARPRVGVRSPGVIAVRGVAFCYLAVMLIIPLVVIFQDGLHDGLGGLWSSISRPVAWRALLLSLWTAGVMALINAVMGTLTAYVLVRYRFPGKTLLNAIVDLPFAIPTLVTGVMLVVLYGPQRARSASSAQSWWWRAIFRCAPRRPPSTCSAKWNRRTGAPQARCPW